MTDVDPTRSWGPGERDGSSDGPGAARSGRDGRDDADDIDVGPGTRVADRYAILDRIGDGGMGRVFLAMDETLGQKVALKFLHTSGPSGTALISEVRQARRITHPHVVRVHDVAEWQGRTFLTMEYVRGEDLQRLLQRIGHLPRDKALQTAREIAYGLRAAHDAGVLHRDLKPANVVLDGDGRARLMDFGVAAPIGGQAHGLAGTPAYLAPELFEGAKPSVRTDIYSLGALLYELFTGQPRADADSIEDLIAAHRTAPRPPSEWAPDIDPDVEALIVDCLQRDPHRRPATMLALLARLPGVDLLGQALASGETPSPELIAAASQGAPERRRRALGLTAAFGVALGAFAWLAPDVTLATRAHLPEPGVVLARDGERLLATLSPPGPDTARASGFAVNVPFVDALRPVDGPPRWRWLDSTRPTTFGYWYRTAPNGLMAQALSGRVTPEDPPFTEPDMARVVVDTDGALRRVQFVPRRGDGPPTTVAQLEGFRDELLAAARLESLQPREVGPEEWIDQPEDYADARRAWRMTLEGGKQVQLEVAMLRGDPVEGVVIDLDWADALAARPVSVPTGVSTLLNIVKLTALFAALVLAWRSVSRGRGDRRGAFRFALAVFALQLLATCFSMDHSAVPAQEGRLLLNGMARSALVAAQYALFYLAMEPHVRRHWPGSIVGWTRLLHGRAGDREVGFAVLAGLTLGALGALTAIVGHAIYGWLEGGVAPPLFTAARTLEAMEGTRHRFGALLEILVFQTGVAMTFYVGIVLCRIVLRRSTIALIAWGILQTGTWLLQGPWSQAGTTPTFWHVLLYGAMSALCLWTVVRVGMLALLFGAYTFGILLAFPVVRDPNHWLFGATLFAGAALSIALIWGLRAACRGPAARRPLGALRAASTGARLR